MSDPTKYRELLNAALQEAAMRGVPARAAWLMQAIRRREPGFRVRDLGFLTFRDLVLSLGGFAVSHDGFDVVVAMAGGDPPVEARRTFARTERIHPALWRAATRTQGSSYLDLAALRDGRMVVVDEAPSDAAAGRFVPIPVPSLRDQAEWLVKWAQGVDLGADVLAELQEALSAGGIPRAISVLRMRQQDRQFLFARVGWTKDRLRDWASQNGIEWRAPVVGMHAAPDADAITNRSDLLRRLVRNAVERLSDDELRMLRLPVGVILDALGEEKP